MSHPVILPNRTQDVLFGIIRKHGVVAVLSSIKHFFGTQLEVPIELRGDQGAVKRFWAPIERAEGHIDQAMDELAQAADVQGRVDTRAEVPFFEGLAQRVANPVQAITQPWRRR